MRRRKSGACRRCTRTTTLSHRGLCRPCYRGLLANDPDALLDYPRFTHVSVELAAEADLIRARSGGTWPEVAAQLGVPFATLDKARQRARRRVSS